MGGDAGGDEAGETQDGLAHVIRMPPNAPGGAPGWGNGRVPMPEGRDAGMSSACGLAPDGMSAVSALAAGTHEGVSTFSAFRHSSIEWFDPVAAGLFSAESRAV